MSVVDWGEIRALLEDILVAVRDEAGIAPLHRLPVRVRARLRLAPKQFEWRVDRLLQAANKVSGVRDVAELEGSGELAHMLERRDERVGPDRFDEVVTDLLTGLWLGLYFLGLPFNPPWERAVQIAETAGGFPHGACVNKAIGDVYRSTRKIYRHEFRAAVGARLALESSRRHAEAAGRLSAEERTALRRSLFAPPGIVVLTRTPLSLLRPDQRALTQCLAALTALGRYYAQYQLSLYAEAGLPITYVVSRAAVEEIFRLPDAARAQVAQAAARTLGAASVPGQAIVLAPDQPATVGMPTCVLGHKRGMYTLADTEFSRDVVPFAGNRVSSEMTAAYRSRLSLCQGPIVRWASIEDLMGQLRAEVTRADARDVAVRPPA